MRRMRSSILRQLQADEEQHCSAAGLRTRYMEKHNLGKKIRVSNASSGVTGLFDSTPQSEKSAVKAPGDKDSSHGFTLMAGSQIIIESGRNSSLYWQHRGVKFWKKCVLRGMKRETFF